MTKMQSPDEIWRDSLRTAPARAEDLPPAIMRVEAWPYPDLGRVWVRLEISSFDAFPNLELTLTDAEKRVVSSMFMVEVRESYQSLTLHLRETPQAGKPYRLEVDLTRDEELLDRRTIDFDLVFRDPQGERK